MMKFAKSAILLCMAPGMYCRESPATFEVASVKPNPALGGLTRYLPNGGIQFIGVRVRLLVEIAYGVHPFQVIGDYHITQALLVGLSQPGIGS
jgi:hypothetical protein